MRPLLCVALAAALPACSGDGPTAPAGDAAPLPPGDDASLPPPGTPDAGSVLPDASSIDAGPPVYAQDFEGLATGSAWLSGCKWKKHVHVEDGCGVGGSKCLRIAQDPVNKEPPLFPLPPVDERPPYPPGSNGVCEPYYTNTATDVVQAVQPVPLGDEYSLDYDLYFEPGYDWARGGKLPGLSGKEWDSGCSVEGDGIPTDPGPARWSVRMMWRAAATNELYVYDQDRAAGACGTRSPTPLLFETGRWIPVTIFVKLNSAPDAHDGVAQMYLDGQLAREESGIRFRAELSDDSRINQIFFSTFFGGNESKRLYCLQHPGEAPYCVVPDPTPTLTWVPAQLSYVRFDNLAVYSGLRVRHAPGQ
jgi:hypothetical protein